MPRYCHSRHAGNFADVAKHVALTIVLNGLRQAGGRVAVLDAHAGAGRYELSATDSGPDAKWHGGIGQIYHRKNAPEGVAEYLRCVRAANSEAALHNYPGSPWLIRSLLGEECELVANDWDTRAHAQLAQEFASDPVVSVWRRDAYQALEQWLSPRREHALVLLDPPFLDRSDFARVVHGLTASCQRMRDITVVAWYPLTTRKQIETFHQTLATLPVAGILCAELGMLPQESATTLTGCGVVVANPPPKTEKAISSAFAWLADALALAAGNSARVCWLSSDKHDQARPAR